MDLFNDYMREAFPERPLSPPEGNEALQQEQEEREIVARNEFDEMTKEALEYTLDCAHDVAILKAAIERDAWGGVNAPSLYQAELVRAIDNARNDYVEYRMKS